MKIFLFIIIVLTLNLSAEPNILIQPEVINFGIVDKTSPIVSIPVILVNRDDELYIIRRIEIKPNTAISITSDLNIPSKIAPDSNLNFNLYLDPSNLPVGEFKAKMLILLDGIPDTIFANITFNIKESKPLKLETVLMIPDISMKIGDEGKIPIILLSINSNIDKLSSVSGTISYNSTIIVPINSPNDKIINGERYTKFETKLEKELKQWDTIAFIPMFAALGNATASEINLIDITFYLNNEPIDGKNSFIDGTLSLNNIYYQNGIPRLVSEVSESLIIYPPVNPVEMDFALTISYSNEAFLTIYSVDGIKIADYSSSLPYHPSFSNETILIRKTDFPVLGSYIIKLASSDAIVSKMIIVK